MELRVVRGDITLEAVDAIVNAANETLLGGGGVDGAIHRAAGPELVAACLELPELRPGVRCPTGEARVTPGFRLRCRWVVHTVGPIWMGGHAGEPAALAACYRNSLRLAAEVGALSVALPAISCGVYGYPLEAAARIAIDESKRALTEQPELDIRFVAFGADVERALGEAISRA
jgi:O-acetyl-ADP-ribose deacetylase (regulator of RNase III)